MEYEKNKNYHPADLYNSHDDIRLVMTQMINGFYCPENPDLFRELYNSLLESNGYERADQYFILKDFRSYADAQKRVEEAYRDQQRWSRMAMMQTACSGKFSSDRTIEEYVNDIWHLEKVEVPSGEDE